MQIALLPILSDANKTLLKTWLETTLANPRLVNERVNFPLMQSMAVYLNNAPRIVYYGQWGDDGTYVRVGKESTIMDLSGRLGVLGAIISLAGLWTELAELYSSTVSRTLLESYNTAMQGLVRLQGSGPATGLAFSADRMQVAAQIGDVWRLPGGVEVQVDEPSWTVVI